MESEFQPVKNQKGSRHGKAQQEQPSETLWVEESDGKWDFGEWRSGVWHALNTSRYKTEDEAITALETFRFTAKGGS